MDASMPCGTPSSKLIFESSSFKNKKSRHEENIREHYFNCCVNLCLPETSISSSDISKILQQHEAYIVSNLPISRLIEQDFIEAFIKTGHIYMLSHATRIDTQDCVALTPTGRLILNCTKDTYEQLGLEGRPSAYKGKRAGKYVVDVELTAPHFIPGKKNYERVKWCLTDRLQTTLDFLLVWVPHKEEISSYSVAQYFRSLGHKCTQIKQKVTFKVHHSFPIPVIDKIESFPATETSCDYKAVYDWLGAVSCDVDLMEGGPDNYISTMTLPEPHRVLDNCMTCSVTGFIPPATILTLVDKLRQLAPESPCPWASLTIHGFADSPIAWGRNEHGFHKSGDNIYTYIIFPDASYWLYRAIGTHDSYNL